MCVGLPWCLVRYSCLIVHFRHGVLDLLTQVLQQAGLVRRLLDLRQLDARRAVRFPCERSMGLHVVTEGRVWIHAPSLPEPLAVEAGEIVLMARGCEHLVSTSATLHDTPAPVIVDLAEVLPLGDSATGSRVLSGAYQLWHAPRHPFFEQLPSWFVVRAHEVSHNTPLTQALGLMRHELESPRIGSHGVQHGLLDVVFTYVLRELLERHTTREGISFVTRDADVLTAVTLLHESYAHPWTLDELATRVGLSRTAFAERFRVGAGDTPLQYLRTIRMQQAMRLLSETNQSLEAIGVAVGYQDAFSFSKIFKRCTGLSPREFRRRDASDRELPYRFKNA